MTEREYLAALYSFQYFGPVRTNLLLNYFGSSETIWHKNRKDFLEVGLKDKIVDSFIEYKNKFELSSYFDKLKKLGIKFVTIKEDDYPENLRNIDSAPVVLYYIGTLHKSDKNAVAIVGSRKMSSYGREVTENFAAELSGLGIVIVSGLALGIDAVAHKTCAELGGRGIVVLASGLDTISPYTNRWIALQIVKKGGSILSEYPLGQPPFRTSFPSRNRIVSGLSKAVIVIEGERKSGTLLTASAAAEQGRTVFAVPGQITSPLSGAPHYLIQNGAKMAICVKDILDELNLQLKVNADEIEKVMPTDKTELKILGILSRESLHLDMVARITGLTVANISASLTIMELKGIVKNMGNGMYKKC